MYVSLWETVLSQTTTKLISNSLNLFLCDIPLMESHGLSTKPLVDVYLLSIFGDLTENKDAINICVESLYMSQWFYFLLRNS